MTEQRMELFGHALELGVEQRAERAHLLGVVAALEQRRGVHIAGKVGQKGGELLLDLLAAVLLERLLALVVQYEIGRAVQRLLG